MNSIPHATCSKCGKTKPLTKDYWHKDKRGRNGFCYHCKDCAIKRSRQWVNDNRERNKNNCKRWYYANPDKRMEYNIANVDRISEWKREWRKANPEKVKKHKRDSQVRNRESQNIRNKRYRENHPEKMRIKSRVEWARRRTAIGKYTQEDILQLYDEQQGYCAYCGIRLFDVYDVDHVIPITKGGTNRPENLLLACIQCNRSKSNKSLAEWMISRGW